MMSSEVAAPLLVSASVCLVDRRAGDDDEGCPLPNPARSMSQPAESLTPPGAEKAGICSAGPDPRRAATRDRTVGSSSSRITGLVKKDPADQVSSSSSSSTIPLPRRSSITVRRTTAGSVRSPGATPRRPASSAYRIGSLRPAGSSRNSTSSTTAQSVFFRTDVR